MPFSMYLSQVLDAESLNEVVDTAVRNLRRHDFDAVAFTGMSGALVAPSVALRLGKGLIMVRKDETRHSQLSVEGVESVRYIILDDRIDTGDTIDRILRSVKEFCPEACCAGVYLWNSKRGQSYAPSDDVVIKMLREE